MEVAIATAAVNAAGMLTRGLYMAESISRVNQHTM
jgi:hypothetical protein